MFTIVQVIHIVFDLILLNVLRPLIIDIVQRAEVMAFDMPENTPGCFMTEENWWPGKSDCVPQSLNHIKITRYSTTHDTPQQYTILHHLTSRHTCNGTHTGFI